MIRVIVLWGIVSEEGCVCVCVVEVRQAGEFAMQL